MNYYLETCVREIRLVNQIKADDGIVGHKESPGLDEMTLIKSTVGMEL